MLYGQIWNLLKREHMPLVHVGTSNTVGAGSGVFSRQSIDTIPTAMCLYPGIYTPGMPPYATQYLANQVPPSFYTSQRGKEGPNMHENAYIMNLQSCGGYIDGWTIKSQYDGEKLDANHSACGHLINHHARDHNTSVYSFCWNDVLEHNTQTKSARRGGDESHFQLPNEMLSDGKSEAAMFKCTFCVCTNLPLPHRFSLVLRRNRG